MKLIEDEACSKCGANRNAIDAIEGEYRPPAPGDPILCCQCGALVTVNADGTLREMQDSELDPATAADVARFRERVRTVNELRAQRARALKALMN